MIKGSGKEWSSTQGWHQQDDVTILCWKGREMEGVAETQADFQQRENGCLSRRWVCRLENTATAETVA